MRYANRARKRHGVLVRAVCDYCGYLHERHEQWNHVPARSGPTRRRARGPGGADGAGEGCGMKCAIVVGLSLSGRDAQPRLNSELRPRFLVVGALNLAGGCWYITIARSAPARA